MSRCIDCGAPTSGVRCRKHNGLFIALQAARELDAEDREILESGVSGDRLAERRHVSRSAAYRRIADAKRRQALLAAHP